MRKNYDVVIIGGGIHGLALSYYLAREASLQVALFEKQYLEQKTQEVSLSSRICGLYISLHPEDRVLWKWCSLYTKNNLGWAGFY